MQGRSDGQGLRNKGCPYCHDFDGSEKWVPPIVINFPIQPFPITRPCDKAIHERDDLPYRHVVSQKTRYLGGILNEPENGRAAKSASKGKV